MNVRGPLLVAAVAVTVATVAGCSSSAGDVFGGAASGPRPADACLMLTSDQVAAIVGTPGPFTGAHEDPDEDGNPVWGCTWGTQQSYADLRELSAKQFDMVSTPDQDTVLTPLSGIGDKALLQKNKSDSYVYFVVGGYYYEAQVTVDRRDSGGTNAAQEISAAEQLAKTLAPRLNSGTPPVTD
jgi:hypothetical protein